MPFDLGLYCSGFFGFLRSATRGVKRAPGSAPGQIGPALWV